MQKLFAFDADGTLWQRDTGVLLPRVAEKCRELLALSDMKFAICSNQGGVGLGLDMRHNGWGNPSNLPLAGPTVKRYENLSRTLFGSTSICPVYLAFRYCKDGRAYYAPRKQADPLRWLPSWRKPEPGMLLHAMQQAGCTPATTTYIGDGAEDSLAAKNAGCRFIHAEDFFK